jgi:hypothetical protein
LAASIALAVATGAHASTNLITNGDFSSGPGVNTQFGAGFGGQTVTGWNGGDGEPAYDLQFYFVGGKQTTDSAINQFGAAPGDPRTYFYPTFNTLSPNSGGNFVALDGDQGDPLHPGAQGAISQKLENLIVGKTYTLTFDWAAAQLENRGGDISEQLAVSFGGQTFNTEILNVSSGGFSGWNTVTMFFTPTSATQTLTFLSIGTPEGLPPIAALDSVTLTVPEPASWAMMLIGFGGIGAVVRRRRHALVAA